MTFGLQTEEDVSHGILDKATDAGVNFIDTADVYPLGGGEDIAGRTEEIIGRWLKGKRDRFILATKAVGKVGPHAWNQGASRKHLLDAIDDSLRRLNTDYVDLYQLHSDDRDTPLDETLEALDVIVRSGKARYIGVSNYLAYRLARMLGRSDVLRTARFVSVQPRYNLLFRQIERELLPLADEEGLAVIPYNPLAGGLLTGKHRHDAKPADGRFTETVGKAGEMYSERYWHEREFKTIETLREINAKTGEPMTKTAIA
jgi:aryl-alcohol dehydrogenase-like predicted oxidoreductase